MQVHHSMNQLPGIPSPVVTVGTFDGVHVGHLTIINRLNLLASGCSGSSVLITFDPHPRKVLYPDGAGKELKMICSAEEKYSRLEEAGLDHLIVLPFTREFARTPADTFVEEYLVGRLHARIIVVGFNHYFGHNKEGNYDSLYRMKEKYGFQVEEIPEQEIQNEAVSSTRIRKALSEGQIQRANAYLDFHYTIHSILHEGDTFRVNGLVRAVNLQVTDPQKLVPPPGSYAVSLHSGETEEKGLIHISGEGITYYALDQNLTANEGPVVLKFHRRLSETPELHLDRDLRWVAELIY